MTNIRGLKVQVLMSDREKEMLDAVAEAGGCSATEMIRELIRAKHEKMNPAYRSRKQVMSPIALTPEQMCEKAGGKLHTNEDGTRVCLFVKPGTGLRGSVPLTMPEKFDDMAEKMGILS